MPDTEFLDDHRFDDEDDLFLDEGTLQQTESFFVTPRFASRAPEIQMTVHEMIKELTHWGTDEFDDE